MPERTRHYREWASRGGAGSCGKGQAAGQRGACSCAPAARAALTALVLWLAAWHSLFPRWQSPAQETGHRERGLLMQCLGSPGHAHNAAGPQHSPNSHS